MVDVENEEPKFLKSIEIEFAPRKDGWFLYTEDNRLYKITQIIFNEQKTIVVLGRGSVPFKLHQS